MNEPAQVRKANPVKEYLLSAFEEFGKVTWPTKEQAALLTAIVIGVTLAVALLIAVFDLGLAQLYQTALKSLTN
ncbi:preprotein translocase subunit SecE [Candidatus Peregrinibacteria bacterium]|nr:preprotein translocase subunit SecE [Candidatus Peregrinibacteria bacterium]